MNIIKLQGGLGNQMFQYAFGLSVSHKSGCPVYFDLSFFKNGHHTLTLRKYELDVFTCKVNIAKDKLIDGFFNPNLYQRISNKLGISKKTIYREHSLKFNSDVFAVRPPAYFEGFWQSEQYFIAIEDLIRKAFSFKTPLNQQSQKIADTLAQQFNTVSVHVRRGDYVSSKNTHELHGVCSIDYYQKAIALLQDQVTDLRFYFFSDDPEWVDHYLLPLVKNGTLVRHNQHNDSWQDIALMSKCKHHIIANSSFSWWGAWLNPEKEKIVMAPANWFSAKTDHLDTRDIIPQNWISIPND